MGLYDRDLVREEYKKKEKYNKSTTQYKNFKVVNTQTKSFTITMTDNKDRKIKHIIINFLLKPLLVILPAVTLTVMIKTQTKEDILIVYASVFVMIAIEIGLAIAINNIEGDEDEKQDNE